MRAIARTRIGAPAVAGALALAAAAAVAALLSAQALAATSGAATSGAARSAASLRGAAVPAPVTVTFGEFFYRPALITVKVGQQVIFKNVGKIAHTVANTDAKGEILSTLIRPQNLDPRQTQVVSFAKPGTVFYLCTFHPTLMKGRIVVTK
jgi:plastocyanin